MSEITLSARLREHPLGKQFVNHDFFQQVKVTSVTKKQAAVLIGQWWRPLHYFSTFLARSVSVMSDIESKCAISKILHQETGEGEPKRAHEIIYIDTMVRAGFTRAEVTDAAPFSETAALVAGYERASENRLTALGFIFATEVADLAMVSAISAAVERATETKYLEWLNIHIQQEPDHVEEAEHAMLRGFNVDEESIIIDSAEEMWGLWTAFFDRLEKEVFVDSLAR